MNVFKLAWCVLQDELKARCKELEDQLRMSLFMNDEFETKIAPYQAKVMAGWAKSYEAARELPQNAGGIPAIDEFERALRCGAYQ